MTCVWSPGFIKKTLKVLHSGEQSVCVDLQVFDFHHQKFCPGTWTTKEAVHAAIATWPEGVRPVVHWSESQEGRKPHAHSDYVSVSVLTFTFLQQPHRGLSLYCFDRAAACML